MRKGKEFKLTYSHSRIQELSKKILMNKQFSLSLMDEGSESVLRQSCYDT